MRYVLILVILQFSWQVLLTHYPKYRQSIIKIKKPKIVSEKVLGFQIKTIMIKINCTFSNRKQIAQSSKRGNNKNYISI